MHEGVPTTCGSPLSASYLEPPDFIYTYTNTLRDQMPIIPSLRFHLPFIHFPPLGVWI